MPKTAKLTASYIKKVTFLKTPKPLYRHIVDSTTLDRSTIDVVGAFMRPYKEIEHDLNNVDLLNPKLDSEGLPTNTRDDSSIHSTISVNVYTFEDETTQVVLPDTIFNDLNSRGIVEEV